MQSKQASKKKYENTTKKFPNQNVYAPNYILYKRKTA